MNEKASKQVYLNRKRDQHKEHPELTFGSNYHFTEFKELTGALHIIGMSPNNDSHIFKLIDESNIENIVFYYHSDSEARIKLPIHQKVEFRSAKELWRRLDASPKQYNCNYPIPKSEKVKDFFAAFNLMSDDKVSEEVFSYVFSFVSNYLSWIYMKLILIYRNNLHHSWSAVYLYYNIPYYSH